MKIRKVLQVMVCCMATSSIFAQSTAVTSKWGTDGAATRVANSMMLDLKIDAGNNVTGSIVQYGLPFCGAPNTSLRIISGMVTGNVVTFVTPIPTCSTAGRGTASPDSDTQVKWTGTLGNDDSLSLSGAAVAANSAGGTSGSGVERGGNSTGNGGSRNPLGTPSNPLTRGGTVTTPSGGANRSPGAALSFPSVVMHRL